MPCYVMKGSGGGNMFICGKLGPHCAHCAAPSGFLCDYPVGKGKTCDAPLCDDHASEIAPELHYCPGHVSMWEAYRESGQLELELSNVVPFRKQRAAPPPREAAPPAPKPKPAPRPPAAPAPDLNKLSRPALSAAMRGGTDLWGQHGSAKDHVRYSEPLEARPGRRRTCYCGCNTSVTHRGMANGIALTSACALGIARWVKTGSVKP